MEDEELTTKSAQTTHATQHKGHRHHVAVLYKDFIPISHHVADTLHTILNLGRQLLQEGVIVRIKTNEQVQAVMDVLRKYVGCFMRVEKASNKKGVDILKANVIGREMKKLVEPTAAECLLPTVMNEGEEDLKYFRVAWTALRLLWHGVTTPIPNHLEETRRAKAADIKRQARDYIVAFANAVSAQQVGLYAHVAYEHFPRWVMLFGDVSDFSCEGPESLHSSRKKDSKTITNKRKQGAGNQNSRTAQSMKLLVPRKKIDKTKQMRRKSEYEEKKKFRAPRGE
ncbi:hypothetical protein CYMTET_33403 [Cymbomonas tetramitiformis]|uniref:Uncharacterized protein n=1 Tax=Cymbomonas tetramitiformis TaxID=36881 RepID=A0AAE0FD38_9CHLO|nr:hypothetical protein CYMTET_33403 [Cymbomonas tetramitiformis]